MSEGELKKRIQQDVCVVLKGVPLSVDELQKTTVYDPVYTHYETVKTVLDEARADIVPGEEYWFDWAKTSQENDSQIVKDYKNMLLRFLKWFGEPK